MIRYTTSLERTIRLAIDYAIGAEHPKATAYHLLQALCDDPDAQEVVRQTGGDMGRLLAEAASGAAATAPPSLRERLGSKLFWRYGGQVGSSFNEAILGAARHLALASRTDVGTTDVLAALFLARDPGLLAALRSSHLSRLNVLRYICHGGSSQEVDSPRSLPDDDPLAVVVLNDHYTEMVVVVEILKKAFDMNVGAAYRTMMRVHQRGRAVLGPFPRNEALERLEKASRILDQKQAPLKLVVCAPDDLGPDG